MNLVKEIEQGQRYHIDEEPVSELWTAFGYPCSVYDPKTELSNALVMLQVLIDASVGLCK